jgi:hypothetical protein
MRTRSMATSLVTALTVTTLSLAPALVHADEPTRGALPAATTVAQSSTERGQVGGPAPAAYTPAPLVLTADEGEHDETVWYGFQNLATDGAAIALGIGAVSLEDQGETLGWTAVATYALGSPIVHLANGEAGRAVGSLALRLGLPVVLGGIGMATASPCPEDSESLCFNGLGELVVGAGIGTIAAVLIDDLFLARKTERVHRDTMWTPTVAPSAQGGMSFGVAGTF